MRTLAQPASPHRALACLASLALLAGPTAALATGGVVKVSGQTAGSVYKFGRSQCADGTKLSFAWDLTGVVGANAYQTGTSLTVWETQTASCTAPAATNETKYPVTAGLTGTTPSIALVDFLAPETCASSTSSSATPGSALLCLGYYVGTASSGSFSEVASAQLQFAMQKPSVPSAVSVSAGDGLLRITWAAGNVKDSIDHYEIFVVEGALDGGTSDAGASDAGTSDAGTSDAGTSDAGTSDAGASDAGTSDAGTSDAGTSDAGTSDAGASDAGASDAGTSDAGTDAGTSDGGASADPFSGAAAVASPSTAGTTVVDHSSSGTALVNGHSYLVRLRAVDTYTNSSDYTASLAGTPTPIDDFYTYYQGQGGTAQGGGGCGAAGVGWTAAVLVLGWLAARRRGGKSGAALLVLALVTGAATAAQAEAPPGQQSKVAPDPSALGPQFKPLTRPGRVPRMFLFALKLDRYDPQIDSQPGLLNPNTGGVGTPYHDIFGTRIPLRVQGEASLVLLHRPWLGSLLAGATVGFWQNIGRGRYATPITDSNGVVVHNKGDRSDDTALLDIWPFGAAATWRLDQLADRYRWFPLVPYAQAGLMTALWASYNGAGKISEGSASKPGHGSGWTYGYTAALGVALALDVIDPMLSNEAYVDLGLQRTSLFAEYAWTRLDDFGAGKSLILSDRQWRFGLSLEF